MTPARPEHRALRLFCAIVGLGGLAILAFLYWFTYEPAPSIRVEWKRGTTPEVEAALERKYLLTNRRGQIPFGSVAYDLLDTRSSNVRAIREDPNVFDTNDLDKDRYIVPPWVTSGERWMWVADRTPGLRDTRVRWTLFAVLVAMAVYGAKDYWSEPIAKGDEPA